MKSLTLLLFVLFFCYSTQSIASHIVGGEMNYRCLGNDQYEITMKIYRDCENGNPGAYFDAPAPIGIFNAQTNAYISVFNMYPSSDDTLANIPFCPPNICLHYAIYEDTITLVTNSSGYVLSYQRCCRSIVLINIANPSNLGMTIFIKITPQALTQCNNSPTFINEAPHIINASSPFSMNLAATDLDGDSLAYTFYAPFNGASTSNPAPSQPSPPPYTTVQFQAPYTSQTPILGSPNITFNPTTGILSGIPSSLGSYVVGLSILEYNASGILLSQTYKDFVINVVTCITSTNTIPTASFTSSIFPNPSADVFTIQCEGQTEISMQIFNQYGAKIHEQNFNNQTDINLTPYPIGVYFVELTRGRERVMKKIVKL